MELLEWDLARLWLSYPRTGSFLSSVINFDRWTVGSDNTTCERTDCFSGLLVFQKVGKNHGLFSNLITDGSDVRQVMWADPPCQYTCLHTGLTIETQGWSNEYSYQPQSSWWGRILGVDHWYYECCYQNLSPQNSNFVLFQGR